MIKLQTVISPSCVETAFTALRGAGVSGMAFTETFDGGVKVEVVAPNGAAQRISYALELVSSAHTIVITPILDAIRIRGGQRGIDALE